MPRIDLITRIRMAVALVGGRQKDAADAIGITQARLSNYLRGVNRPADEILDKLAAAAGLSAVWLIRGEGPMMADEATQQPDQQPQPVAEPLCSFENTLSFPAGSSSADQGEPAADFADSTRQQDVLDALRVLLHGARPAGADAARAGPSASQAGQSALAMGKVIPAEDYQALAARLKRHFVPILGRTAAGLPSLAPDGVPEARAADEYVCAPGSPPNTFAMRVEGDSMLPDLPPGSIVLVGSRMDPLPDHPVHALVVYRDEMGNTRHTVKMVSTDGSQVCLRPLNFRLYREQRIPKDRVLSAFAAMRRIA